MKYVKLQKANFLFEKDILGKQFSVRRSKLVLHSKMCVIQYVVCLIFLFNLRALEAQPSYTVVAPKIVRPNSDFLVAVSVYNIGDQGNNDSIV